VLPCRVCVEIKVNSAAVDSEFPKNKQYNKMRGIIYSLSKHIGRAILVLLYTFTFAERSEEAVFGLSVIIFVLFFF